MRSACPSGKCSLSRVTSEIAAASCSHEEIEQFIHFTNTFHLNLKSTWTISLFFLDLSVSSSGNHLETDIHFKPTDSHSYLE
eukprot:g27493.t1